MFREQKPDEAFEYVWALLQRMEFFRANGYRLALPEHPAFQQLADGTANLAEVDRDELRRVFVADVYREADFGAGLQAARAVEPMLDQVLAELGRMRGEWGFELFPRYRVLVTLFGPGGSYAPDTGTITMLTTRDGRFKGGGPLHTIVHEMVHLGIERPIVQRFGLTHWEKERLVDLICSIRLRDVLPDYRLQSKGHTELDAYVDEAALADLPGAIERYAAGHPRR